MMKRALETLGWLAAVALFAFAGHAVLAAQTPQARGRAETQLSPSHVGASAASRQDSQDESGRRTRDRRAEDARDLSPASIARGARTLFVSPTKHLDKKYLEYKLQKHRELREWNLMLVADPAAADLVITFDKTALNYIFTVTDRRTSIIVASGKAVAINGLVAAEYLGREIVKKMKDVRAGPEHKSKKKGRDKGEDEDDDEWSES